MVSLSSIDKQTANDFDSLKDAIRFFKDVLTD